MRKFPEKVTALVERLRIEYSPYLHIAVSKAGKYLLYEYISRHSKRSERDFRSSVYIGTITEDGILIPTRRRPKEHKERHKEEENGTQAEISRHDLEIVKILSMDGRATIPEIAKKIGLSTSAAAYQIKKAEEKYGIEYLLEIDFLKLGFQSFIAFVKFTNEVPQLEIIKKALEDIPEIQLVMMTSGEYHLVIYFYSMNNTTVFYMTRYIKEKTQVKDYDSEWYVAPHLNDFGTLPTRAEFFRLLEKIVWHRTKDTPRPESWNITNTEYAVLKSLSSNGAANFSDIDKNNGFEYGASRYAYNKLIKKGIIIRPTINLTKLPIKHIAIFLMEIVNGKDFFSSEKVYLSEMIRESSNINDLYTLVNDVAFPISTLFIMPIFRGGEFENKIREIKTNIKGLKIKELMVSNVVLGSLCYRRFDKEQTYSYEKLKEIGRQLPT